MNRQTEFKMRIPVNVGALNDYMSPEYVVNHFAWRVETKKMISNSKTATMGILLHCNIEEPGPSDWSCIATATICLISPQDERQSIEKNIYFTEFNQQHNRRDYEHFILWNDLPKFVSNDKITMNIEIQAIGLSNANNTIELESREKDNKLHIRAGFKDIENILGAVSNEIPFFGSRLKLYIFKRACEHDDGNPALWFYFSCHSDDNARMNLSYKLRLLSDNFELGPLCAQRNVTLSNRRDAAGNPLLFLKDLFDPQNLYVSSNGAIRLAMEFEMNKTSPPRIKCMPIGYYDIPIKIEPQSPPIAPLQLPEPNIDSENDDYSEYLKSKRSTKQPGSTGNDF